MLNFEAIRSDEKAPRRKSQRVAKLLSLMVLAFGSSLSAPAGACICACAGLWDAGKVTPEAETAAAEYEQVFSGFVISTERTQQPVIDPPISVGEFVEDPGYWIKSKILVLRVWRGAPLAVAEVWTPITNSCDLPPITGFHFLALVKSEKGRSVASHSPCDCNLKAAATRGPSTFTIAGVSFSAAAILAGAGVLLWLVKAFRRRLSAT